MGSTRGHEHHISNTDQFTYLSEAQQAAMAKISSYFCTGHCSGPEQLHFYPSLHFGVDMAYLCQEDALHPLHAQMVIGRFAARGTRRSRTLPPAGRYITVIQAYRKVCKETGCGFFDAGSVTTSSDVDGVHLDLEQHLALGKALAEVVEPLLCRSSG